MGETQQKTNKETASFLTCFFFKITLISANRVLNVTFFSSVFCLFSEPMILYPIAAGFYGLQAFGADARGGNDTERVAGNFEGGQLWSVVELWVVNKNGRCFSLNGDVCFPNKKLPNHPKKWSFFKKNGKRKAMFVGETHHFRTPPNLEVSEGF